MSTWAKAPRFQRRSRWNSAGGEHELGVAGEGAEHMSGGTVMEVVETAAQGLAIKGDAAPSRCCFRDLKQSSVAAEGRFHRNRVEPLDDVADSSMRRRTVDST